MLVNHLSNSVVILAMIRNVLPVLQQEHPVDIEAVLFDRVFDVFVASFVKFGGRDIFGYSMSCRND